MADESFAAEMARRKAANWIDSRNRQREIQYPGARVCRYFRAMWRIHYGQINPDGRGAHATCEFATPDEVEAREAYVFLKANPDPFYYVDAPIPPDPAHKCSWCPTYYDRPHCPPGRDPRNALEKAMEAPIDFVRALMQKVA